MSTTPPRVITLWAPDWPVIAAARARGIPEDAPFALTHKGTVMACSRSARAEGVRRGLRPREAQARCTSLLVQDYDPGVDARAFEPIIAGIEDVTPGVQVLRPGVCVVRARGASRFYGSEEAAAHALVQRMIRDGAPAPRAGVADSLFAAQEAAKRAGEAGVFCVPSAESADFLAPLPVQLLEDDRLVTLLQRLGIRTLGDFAALSSVDVQTRFGPEGARWHAIASGRDPAAQIGRTPPPELDLTADFEPALERVDEIAFTIRAAAEDFVQALTSRRLACTGITVEFRFEDGRSSQRTWLHPHTFSAAEVVDRVRWQLEGQVADAAKAVAKAKDEDPFTRAGVTGLRVSPAAVDSLGHYEHGLWGGNTDERVHHALSRVQSMLGHDAVLMPVIAGGRTLGERQRMIAWGDRPTETAPVDRPWPGHLPDPLPGTVFAVRHPLEVCGQDGAPVTVDERGMLSAGPAEVTSARGQSRRVIAWAGPWPLDERWWARQNSDPGDALATRPRPEGPAHRVQVVDDTGCGWLLVLDSVGWWTEARYD